VPPGGAWRSRQVIAAAKGAVSGRISPNADPFARRHKGSAAAGLRPQATFVSQQFLR